MIEGLFYLMGANNTDGSNRTTGSDIYKRNKGKFIKIYTLSTQGVRDIESFKIKGKTYIAVANDDKEYSENILFKDL